ncbi:unnamed protein product [Owenia fusiformis]|uniref:Innexin n=1 Tax=Owenia fusiformis TaxID=6347 RepID=A0A8J1YA83_OWEFU|nr:unnamed protein product [Owenia fusiformis]
MGSIISASNFSRFGKRHDDDFSDRLSHQFTCILLLISSLFVTGRQYSGHPIDCWTPAHFKSTMNNYVMSLCWTKNTYYVAQDEDIPKDDDSRSALELVYYQWVPLILLTQMACFFLPSIVWKSIQASCGVDIHRIVKLVNNAKNINPTEREKNTEFVVETLCRYFNCQNKSQTYTARTRTCIAKNTHILCGDTYGNRMIASYLIIKLLYIGNAVVQIILLNAFLKTGTNYTFFGFEVLLDLVRSGDWTTSDNFPRTTLCDFKIREFEDNIHRYTIQCVLSINLFNEKIYICLWIWFVLVAAVSSYSFISWYLFSILDGHKHRYIKSHLQNLGVYNPSERGLLDEFIESYIRQDGLFILRILTANTSDIVAAEAFAGVWLRFKQQSNRRKNGIKPEVDENDYSTDCTSDLEEIKSECGEHLDDDPKYIEMQEMKPFIKTPSAPPLNIDEPDSYVEFHDNQLKILEKQAP